MYDFSRATLYDFSRATLKSLLEDNLVRQQMIKEPITTILEFGSVSNIFF